MVSWQNCILLYTNQAKSFIARRLDWLAATCSGDQFARQCPNFSLVRPRSASRHHQLTFYLTAYFFAYWQLLAGHIQIMVELWQLCSDGDVDGVKAALANGAGVNSRGGRGNYTCLMWAAYGQSEPVVSLLLQQPGIQLNARSQNNRTALHFACHYGSGKMVKRLLAEPGIDCNVRGVEGRTPLMVAVEADREEVVREMVAVQGVDITTRDAEGRSLEEVGRWFL